MHWAVTRQVSRGLTFGGAVTGLARLGPQDGGQSVRLGGVQRVKRKI